MIHSFAVTVGMNSPRDGNTESALSDGTILVTGGVNNTNNTDNTLSSIEIYASPIITEYVNPKYIIVGVSYAQPGSASTLSYANSVVQGNTTTITNSHVNTNGLTVSVSVSKQIMGIAVVPGGSAMSGFTYTASVGANYTESSMSSNAVTIQKQASFGEQPHGPPDANFPVNSDYDYVWLWLNPELVFTVDPNYASTLLWNGYGLDPTDAPEAVLYPVLIGQFNGDMPLDKSVADVLARLWVHGQTFPPGDGPGSTSAEMASIADADPLNGCTYDTGSKTYSGCHNINFNTTSGNFGPPLPSNSVDGRFTQVFLPPSCNNPPCQNPPTPLPQIPYVQGGPSTPYMASTTNTTVNTQQSGHTFMETFGLDVNFMSSTKLAIFSASLSIDTKYSQSFTLTHSYQQALTSTQMNTSSFTIVPPPCTVATCSTYAGPGLFQVYQDNLYGTYLFFPAQ